MTNINYKNKQGNKKLNISRESQSELSEEGIKGGVRGHHMKIVYSCLESEHTQASGWWRVADALTASGDESEVFTGEDWT